MPQAENKTGHRAVEARGIAPGRGTLQAAGPCRLHARGPRGARGAGAGLAGVRKPRARL